MQVGIVGYGAYIPRFRIKVEEIAKVWNTNAAAIKDGLLVDEKSVPNDDEDTVTISVEAARNALARAGIQCSKIGAVYIGSESHPYAVKPSGTIGADTAQGRPGDALEYTAAGGGAAFVIGRDPLAVMEDVYTYTTDTPDFWRRPGEEFPSHGGRFTGEPGYFKHITSAINGLMEKMGLKPNDFDYAALHMPNGKFPLRAAKMVGLDKEKVLPGLIVTKIGNTYAGSSVLALTQILDTVAKPGQRILLASYGSGAGGDAFSFIVTDKLLERVSLAKRTQDYIDKKTYLSYGEYVKLRRKLKV